MKQPATSYDRRSGEAGHVLVVAPTPFFSDRGCHVRILEEIRAAEANGYRCTVCTYHLGRDIEGLVIHRSLNVPWYRKVSAGPSVHKFYLDGLLLWTCLKSVRRDRPDLIHAHLHEGIVIGKVVSLLGRVPLIGDLQGSLAGELAQHQFVKPGGLLYGLFAKIERWINRWPDHLVLSSDRATATDSRIGESSVTTTIIADAVDHDVFTPSQPGEQLRKKLGLDQTIPARHKIVGYLGLLDEYQGASVMLEAVRRVVEQFAEVHFLIMGYPNVERYQALAATLGISKHVTFGGRIPYAQARDYLGACNIGFSAKRDVTEANGKLLNYMAVGLPTVATDTAFNRGLLGEEAALYGQVDDPQSLAAALLTLLRDETKAAAMGEAARRRAVAELSWSAAGRRLVELYRSVIGAGAARRSAVERAPR